MDKGVVFGNHKLCSEKNKSPVLRVKVPRVVGNSGAENLKRWAEPNWGSDCQAEESYPRVQSFRSIQKRVQQIINLVPPYEYVPLFLMLTCRRKGPDLKYVSVLLSISAVFDLKQVSLNVMLGRVKENMRTRLSKGVQNSISYMCAVEQYFYKMSVCIL